jgi:hypothetical protein|tara:strand:- start:1363 stop:1953 length:591 start_codon:yes stop_codon:yes gene_type:complete
MSKNWTGNMKSTYVTLGASNHTEKDREVDDYYATNPSTIKPLLDREDFGDRIWECACGEGHLSRAMANLGKDVFSSDKVDRGFGNVFDFLEDAEQWDGDIITNPPYRYAQEFIEKAISILKEGKKVAMFLKVQFLEGQRRYGLFEEHNPKVVYIFSKRQSCAMNGRFDLYPTSAVAYAWFVWEKGYVGETIVRWIK